MARTHWMVLACAGLFGLSLVVVTPPFSVPDEYAHFLRAYHCSEGNLLARKVSETMVGEDMPASLPETFSQIVGDGKSDAQLRLTWTKAKTLLRQPLDSDRRTFCVCSNTALYAPVPYVPAAIAMRIGRWGGASPLGLFYLGRLANLAAYLAIAVAAVRLTPILRSTLALVAMMPMGLFLAASLSADAVTLGLAFLATALVLRLALGAEKVSIAGVVGIALVFTMLALSKQVYVLLSLLWFLVPMRKCGGWRRYALLALVVVGIPVVLNAAWALAVRSIYVPLLPYVDPQAQLQYLASHPLSYARTMCKAMIDQDEYLHAIGIFGWLSSPLPKAVAVTYWLALVATAVLDGTGGCTIHFRARAIAAGLYVVAAGLVVTFIYLSWDAPGAHRVEGLQPRYFLPLLPLLALALRVDRRLVPDYLTRFFLPAITFGTALLAAMATWYTLAEHFYFAA